MNTKLISKMKIAQGRTIH